MTNDYSAPGVYQSACQVEVPNLASVSGLSLLWE